VGDVARLMTMLLAGDNQVLSPHNKQRTFGK
jgi:hypothetical protein